MPLNMRVPKLKGFNNPFRVEYQGDQPRRRSRPSGLDEVDPDDAARPGASSTRARCQGARPRRDHPRRAASRPTRFSKSAEAAITAAGGSVELCRCRSGDGRPPAKGNQLTNR